MTSVVTMRYLHAQQLGKVGVCVCVCVYIDLK